MVSDKIAIIMIEASYLHQRLKALFGFDHFRGEQAAVIQQLLAGNDVFVLMPTGGGKSLCYQLPALVSKGTAIVVSPLIALMKNQVDAVRQCSKDERIAHAINSSLNKATITQIKKDISAGHTKLLFVAPESLANEANIDFFRQSEISFFAIDEAHCISEWGHDFRPEYRKLRQVIDSIGRRPIIALTATATAKVKADIKKILGITEAYEFKSSFNRSNLYYEVQAKTGDTEKTIIKFIKRNPNKSGIIYCLSRKKVEDLTLMLRANDIKAEAYHAGMDATSRAQTQDNFLTEKTNVIVATIAFGMGIDKPDVRFVMHYDIPKSLEGYYQETGRAGRDGKEGKCYAFYSDQDMQKFKKFMNNKPIAEQEVGKLLLQAMTNYTSTPLCRRALLLNYFGEIYEATNCGNCDNCLKSKHYMEAKEQLKTALEVIVAVKDKFREDYIINILTGRETDELENHKHTSLTLFGAGDDYDERFWSLLLQQARNVGYIEKDDGDFGLLKVTAKGKKFIKSPLSFQLIDESVVEEEEPDLSKDEGLVDKALLKLLEKLRADKAKELGIAPYLIFQNSTLEAMATMYPETLEELQNITGVGAGKIDNHGKAFCKLIKEYCEQNKIERPENTRIKSAPNKASMKVSLIQSIDRKVPLDDLAESKGIEFDDLLRELESIVYSGMRINIDYFLNEVMDEDQILDIYEYFEEAQTDSLDTAMDELGDEFTEEEVRLVRIKFISEVAN